MFEQSIVDSTRTARTGYTFLFSGLLQGVLLAAAAVAPLFFSSTLPRRALMGYLTAPGPPAAASPVTAKVVSVVKPRFDEGRLIEPARIPRQTPMLVDDIAPGAAVAAGPAQAGVLGGLPGYAPGSVIAEIAIPPRPPVPAPAAQPEAPVPAQHAAPYIVGGDVQRAKQIFAAPPVYPVLARQARISGVVRLNAIIGKEGAVERLTVVSGHPILIHAALEAVRKWRYRPTLLNGKPVEVHTEIAVHFTLRQ